MVDAHSYSILIKGCKHKNIDKAVMLFEEMSRKGWFGDFCVFLFFIYVT